MQKHAGPLMGRFHACGASLQASHQPRLCTLQTGIHSSSLPGSQRYFEDEPVIFRKFWARHGKEKEKIVLLTHCHYSPHFGEQPVLGGIYQPARPQRAPLCHVSPGRKFYEETVDRARKCVQRVLKIRHGGMHSKATTTLLITICS